ncbi:hypothetical protein ACL9RF_02405 [Sphingobacterium sp. Mn56C]|uniref:hypothetical protein n=1 Tax=Sphingobacterium sp. Mn56C TaxID=3395261 RepID=UPI003BBE046A
MEHIAGDKLYIDFSGKKLHYIDRSTGEMMACDIFVVCLPFSDYAFAVAVRSQQTPDFLYVLSKKQWFRSADVRRMLGFPWYITNPTYQW